MSSLSDCWRCRRTWTAACTPSASTCRPTPARAGRPTSPTIPAWWAVLIVCTVCVNAPVGQDRKNSPNQSCRKNLCRYRTCRYAENPWFLLCPLKMYLENPWTLLSWGKSSSSLQGCGSGPFLTRSGSCKSECEEPDPPPLLDSTC